MRAQFRTIISFSPIVYGLLYFSLIPVFAALYAFGEFGGNSPPSGIIGYLYFSVVTITTLGYGDAFPSNDPSRFLCLVESLLGIFTIGLFLHAIANSVSEEIRKDQEKKQKPVNDFVNWSLLRAPTTFLEFAFQSKLIKWNIEERKIIRFGKYFGGNNAFTHEFEVGEVNEVVQEIQAKLIRTNVLPNLNDLTIALSNLGVSVRQAFSPHATAIDPELLESALLLSQQCEYFTSIINSDGFVERDPEINIKILNNHFVGILDRVRSMQDKCINPSVSM